MALISNSAGGAPSLSSARGRLRIGEFEADLDRCELRKAGLRIRLQDQPFRILALLLERPGDLVTREELRRRLWPADTFVCFDHSLNTAMTKLRAALNDSAATPRYIETRPRRGYRFIGPVEVLAGNGKPAAARTAHCSEAQPPGKLETAPPLDLRRRLLRLFVPLLALLGVAALPER